jgi:hypothetical protein
MRRVVSLVMLFLLVGCATVPLRQRLAVEHPPSLGILGLKVTAPVHHLSAIAQVPHPLSPEEELERLHEALQHVEAQAAMFLIADLHQAGTVVPVVIPDGYAGTQRGERPTPAQIEQLRHAFGVEALLYGEIPAYGRTRLIYPIVGEGPDITAESIALGVVTSWNPVAIFANVGFELLTSTPLWFGGAYLFGWVFRPLTVKAWVLSTAEGQEVWHTSVDRIVSRKMLKTYPEAERSKKEIQLEATLQQAMQALATALSTSRRTLPLGLADLVEQSRGGRNTRRIVPVTPYACAGLF